MLPAATHDTEADRPVSTEEPRCTGWETPTR